MDQSKMQKLKKRRYVSGRGTSSLFPKGEQKRGELGANCIKIVLEHATYTRNHDVNNKSMR